MRCPNCGLDCFPQATRCQCGYPLANSTPGAVPQPPPVPHFTGRPSFGGYTPEPDDGAAGGETQGFTPAHKQILVGLVFLVLGLAVTIGTYRSVVAEGGGTYLIAYGPIIFGAVSFLRGIGGTIGRG